MYISIKLRFDLNRTKLVRKMSIQKRKERQCDSYTANTRKKTIPAFIPSEVHYENYFFLQKGFEHSYMNIRNQLVQYVHY